MALRVIGAGFGRTGTNSLKLALEEIGYGPCHHMFELWDVPEQLHGWQAAAKGNLPDWDKVFAGYESQIDWPGARFWRELAEYYPKANVILSVREEGAWYDSVKSTIVPLSRVRKLPGSEHMRAVADTAYEIIVQQTFGGNINDREHAISIFRQHNADVQQAISPERLLVYNVSDGWEPLCQFLDVSVPDSPFPHANRRQSFPGGKSSA